MVYKLAVGAMFKNEEHVMKEWLEHYLFHGVEHFYLIDDGSTDASVDILQEYLSNGVVTLFRADCPYYTGRQCDMYNKFILPRLADTEWLLMIDLDEFVWSPYSRDLREVLVRCKDIGQIQVEHTVFGSSGLVKNPLSVVDGYRYRSSDTPTKTPGMRKYFVNTKFRFISLNVHHATFAALEDEKNKFKVVNDPYFRLNHYCCQSVEFWRDVKCKRGDVNNYRVRTMEDFDVMDQNQVEDTGLVEQNEPIIHLLLKSQD
jgi:glycosyltransferase involved in cell wall biosynthesis